jgi:prepilin signal peptidase PulO-like enzyme (type II secretory pathway)
MTALLLVLIIFGIAFGSFINALVWRLHQQELQKSARRKHKDGQHTNSKLQASNYSVLTGRSMCPHCEHQLLVRDLVPIISWLLLKGRCRYCKKSISWQYPLVELATAVLFVVSYIAWPTSLNASHYSLALFVTWLIVLVGLVALVIYDLKWMLLPDKIVVALAIVTGISLLLQLALGRPLSDLPDILISMVIGGGIFWLLYQISKGKWIGGGDVKLGLLLGFILGKPVYAFLYIFIASVIALLFSLPLLITKKLKPKSKIPFGPFLITAAVIVVLFGAQILDAYKSLVGI